MKLRSGIYNVGSYVLLPIIVGGLIYICWGVESLLVFDWLRYLQLDLYVSKLRSITMPFRPIIPSIILYNLPDGLWVFAFTSLMLNIWNYRIHYENFIWVISGFFMAVIAEVGQVNKLRLIPGTFDWLDLVMYALGCGLSIYLLTEDAHESTLA